MSNMGVMDFQKSWEAWEARNRYPEDTSPVLVGTISIASKLAMICSIAILAINCCVLCGKVDGVVAGWYTAALYTPALVVGILTMFVKSTQKRCEGVLTGLITSALITIALLGTQGVISPNVVAWCVVVPAAISVALGSCCIAVGCCALCCIGVVAGVGIAAAADSTAETNSMLSQRARGHATRRSHVHFA